MSRDERQIPGPFTIDELIQRQKAYILAIRAGMFRPDHLDTGWSLDELWDMKESLERLDDY